MRQKEMEMGRASASLLMLRLSDVPVGGRFPKGSCSVSVSRHPWHTQPEEKRKPPRPLFRLPEK